MDTKRILIAAIFFAAVLTACSAKAETDIQKTANSSGGNGDTSYAFGLFMGMNLKSTGFVYDFDHDEVAQGFKDAFEGNDTRFTSEEADAIIQTAFAEFQDKLSADNKEKETAFLADNGKRDGVVTTASGLQYEIITQGTGPKPDASNTVKVNYEGTLIDGTVFDSSYVRNEPAEFPLEGVISGWTEGIQLMPVGSVYKLYLPSELAYGVQGAGGVIGPNSLLIFRVELLEIIE
ncbi:MAG: FKBP-type peptidyl-prolyl cis-trans isomerase [Spirochaetaceae bacterium]|jgi:FKBP-type peptidyl-prolyl cis-trans isomerase FkpA|nr:FKBP-type peptidyl-prolyl cis-trans isomerase [Spirochaetaceae bacterium]